MSEVTKAENEQYNSVARKYAEKLVEFRRASQKAAGVSEKTIEALFPSFNRIGLGVNVEYARMGNQPVSAELQARADGLGVVFEHIGLTLGTILHHIDLKVPLAEELTLLVRKPLAYGRHMDGKAVAGFYCSVCEGATVWRRHALF